MRTLTRKRTVSFDVEDTFTLCDRCGAEFRSNAGAPPEGSAVPPGYWMKTGPISPADAGWAELLKGGAQIALFCPPCVEAVVAKCGNKHSDGTACQKGAGHAGDHWASPCFGWIGS